jgi:hypothetical protein
MRTFTSIEYIRAEQIAEMLQYIEPGYLPTPLFYQVARLVATPVVEVVPILKETSDVLLVRRPESDPFFSSLMHFPGTVIRATDKSLSDSIHRVIEEELFLPSNTILVHFVFQFMSKSARGTEVATVQATYLDEIPLGFQAYDPAKLPDDIVPHHRTIIEIMKQEGRWLGDG